MRVGKNWNTTHRGSEIFVEVFNIFLGQDQVGTDDRMKYLSQPY